ncbi:MULTISPECIES: CPBP family intramembrane glutamic endopeptidase [Streptomyces]|uniref:CPBP family intramembrane glutamic endopeptidase n=1 Tax=Streptomyces TaxID=1883 RepID=UPI002F94ED4B
MSHRTDHVVEDRKPRRSRSQLVGHLLVCFFMWFALLMASQALRDLFVFLPGFVPWAGESRRRFLLAVGVAAGCCAAAVFIAQDKASVRAAARRLVDTLGLWPASMRQVRRWAAVALGAAVLLWATAQLMLIVPGLTSVPDTEDPRHIAVAATSTLLRFCYGLIAAAPLEEVLFRGPLLALWLALLAAERHGSWLGHRWVRRPVIVTASTVSMIYFAADHTMGGSANIAHAAVCAAITTVVALWQRSLIPAIAAHALYDACVFAWA